MPFGHPGSHRAMYRKRLEKVLGCEPDDAIIDRSLDVYIAQCEYYDMWFDYDPVRAITLLGVDVVRAEQKGELDALNAQAFSDDYDEACLENAIRDFVRQY